MTGMADTVFLFDVDNTALDNDRVQADLGVHLARYYGEERAIASGKSSRNCVRNSAMPTIWGRWNAAGLRRCTIQHCCAWPTGWWIIRSRSVSSERDGDRESGAACWRRGHPVGRFQPRKVEGRRFVVRGR
jgi:hypothetical protein